MRILLFVHSSFYIALKLTLPWDISNLSLDSTIKSEMAHGSMGQVISVHTLNMFNADSQLYLN